ncbi:MAG TPA: glycoside hydrolase family 92 protein [Bacteroidales bacterium]|nr:MAG: Glycosyl hydrolase family 92 [Bacteroidetes bacterium ADurb.Bin139]HOG26047.1 glycoside hydrolase family 92 protein [Bacteroidales bacterium]HOR11717.1 glycoside hydrolase family 92 protein [Bacteroidales bacterium]HOZ20047.1 glycoside hydrolase family 92 protein [Bacteroidales bacterium]HPB77539.1 glycoside hydrolase family 92 protein [Bacteroidales bacterium]
MIRRFSWFVLAVCFPAILSAGSLDQGICVPFGGVKVVPRISEHQAGKTLTIEHRFFNHGSGLAYGSMGLVPSAGPLSLQEGTAPQAPGSLHIITRNPDMDLMVTATPRGAMHRYAFFTPSGEPQKEGRILLDLSAAGHNPGSGESPGAGKSPGTWKNHGSGENPGSGESPGAGDNPGSGLLWVGLRIEDPNTVTGSIINRAGKETRHTFFAMRFSRPVKYFYATDSSIAPENYPLMGGPGLEAVFVFDLVRDGQQFVGDGVLEIQVAFSSVDALGALNNLKAEQEGKSFETLLWEAGQLWEKELDVITVDDLLGNELLESRRTLFYSSLSQTIMYPALSHDVDGRFRGNDNNIHTSEYHVNYAALYPGCMVRDALMTFIKPDRSRQFAASALAYYDRSVPKLLPGESVLHKAMSHLTDACVKGILPASLTPRFLEAMTTTLQTPFQGLTKDFSYANWCLMVMASGEGYMETVNRVRPYVTAYQWHIDSLACRDALLFVPHNMADIVERTGGRKGFEQRLDSASTFRELPYLYTWTAAPWKGQEKIREMMNAYCPEDESPAWFVFSALGLYPLCPGTDQYVLGAPYFKKMTVRLEGGRVLTIEAPRLTDKNIYVKEVKWNGKVLDSSYITHGQLLQGGILEFSMTDHPVRGRSFRNEKLPYSFLKK